MQLVLGILMAGVSLVAGCERWDVGLESATMAGQRQNEMWMVEYGWFPGDDDPDLAYAVFSRKIYDGAGLSNQIEMHHVGSPMGSNVPNKKKAFLVGPEGERIRLPARNQLFEVVDGELAVFEGRVTLREFKGFFSSAPTRVSAAALLDHVRKVQR
jgi:hypothetical protein